MSESQDSLAPSVGALRVSAFASRIAAALPLLFNVTVPVKSLFALMAEIAPLPASSVTAAALIAALKVWLPSVLTFWMLAVFALTETPASAVPAPTAPSVTSPPLAVIERAGAPSTAPSATSLAASLPVSAIVPPPEASAVAPAVTPAPAVSTVSVPCNVVVPTPP